jgi:Tfp pilus assembly protein PilZ
MIYLFLERRRLRFSNHCRVKPFAMDMSGELLPSGNADSKREKSRESMFLLASLCFEGSNKLISTRVRNISSGGMMVDNATKFEKGHVVAAELKGIGNVMGIVAWITPTRMGISFEEEVDPKLTRQLVGVTKLETNYAQIKESPRRPGLAIR